MQLSVGLAEKSVQAVVSAIEIYNKPNFSYREEAFALLMTNAWELLIKAKWLAQHNDDEDSLYDLRKDKDGNLKPKLNRTGTPLSVGLPYLIAKLLEDKTSDLGKACHDNILALIEIRDAAAHLINKDLYLGRRVLEIGTASLGNYVQLAGEWFGLDLAKYNFFLMPISFFHGFEFAEPVSRTIYSEQVQKLLAYLDSLEAGDENKGGECQHFALRIETRLRRSKDASALEFRISNDPNAPVVNMQEEDIRERFPWTYSDFIKTLRERYIDFRQDSKFHETKNQFMKDPRYVHVRSLDSKNPKSAKQKFFNPNILREFDQYYRRAKAVESPTTEQMLLAVGVPSMSIQVPNPSLAGELGSDTGGQTKIKRDHVPAATV